MFYYPTGVIFVDNSAKFLNALHMKFSDTFLCSVYQNPYEALVSVNKNYSAFNSSKSSLSYSDCCEPEDLANKVLSSDRNKANLLSRELELSVVVVDYDMPGMNGISFCEKIMNPNIKKILLTGQATESQALKAFNDGIINYFIQKSDINMSATLHDAIVDLQHKYFRDVSISEKANAINSFKNLFTDFALKEYFSQICVSMDVEEYYYLANPSRFKLVSRDGNESYLLIYSEQELLTHLKILEEEDAPPGLISQLKSRKYVPYFQTMDGYYEPEAFSFYHHLLKAEKVQGTTMFYCAITSTAKKYVAPTTMQGSSVH